ncbi:unnamed protein product [Lymnaea stagnalis]|uniref:Uncharacterized protein n=1 Tax=Lymnaea stagnalis TaxID=6523 RepID=A0AAV2IGS8_LYMST
MVEIITIETIPLIFAMILVVPFTFEIIRAIVEDKLDFDVVINLTLLRLIELFIAVLIFPTSLMYILVFCCYRILVEALGIAFRVVDYWSAPRIFERLYYYVTCVIVYLAVLIGLIIFIKFVAKAF